MDNSKEQFGIQVDFNNRTGKLMSNDFFTAVEYDAGASLHPAMRQPTNTSSVHSMEERERHQPSFQNLNFDLNVCKAAYLDPIQTRQPLNVIHCNLMRVGSLEGKAR
jgi:hypothetical protein